MLHDEQLDKAMTDIVAQADNDTEESQIDEVASSPLRLECDPYFRTFNLGFTTWDFGYQDRNSGASSQDFMFEKLKRQSASTGDIIGLHYMSGMPWGYAHNAYYRPEDLDTVYPHYHNGAQNINAREFLLSRIEKTAPHQTIYFALDPLNTARDALTYRLSNPAEKSFKPIGGDSTSIDLGSIHFAYSNYAIYSLWLVYKHYKNNGHKLPKLYFNYGGEASNLLIGDNGSQEKWDKFEVFSKNFYKYMKNYSHPTDDEFSSFVRGAQYHISIVLKSPCADDPDIPCSSGMRKLKYALADSNNSLKGESMNDFIDMVGISTYPYLFYNSGPWTGKYHGASPYPLIGDELLFVDHEMAKPDRLPDDWLSQIKDIAPGKPYAVTETAWPAEDIYRPRLLNLNDPANPDRRDDYLITSNPDNQYRYFNKLFREANELDLKFIMVFSFADYDILSDFYQTNADMSPDKLQESIDFLNILNSWNKTGFYKLSDNINSYEKYLNFTGDFESELIARPVTHLWSKWRQIGHMSKAQAKQILEQAFIPTVSPGPLPAGFFPQPQSYYDQQNLNTWLMCSDGGGININSGNDQVIHYSLPIAIPSIESSSKISF